MVNVSKKRMCEGKIPFETKEEAMEKIKELDNQGKIDGIVKPYKCRYCGKFHIGHKEFGK